MPAYYGLQKGDQIITVGDYGVNVNDDDSLAKDMLTMAYQKSQPIVVVRNGERVTLPLQASASSNTTPGTGANPTSAPTVPTPSAPSQTPPPNHSVQDQINQLLKTQPQQ